MVKISAAFLERSIDNLCYATYMYKVAIRERDRNLRPIVKPMR